MNKEQQAMKETIVQAIMRRFVNSTERREEALRDVLKLMIASASDAQLGEQIGKIPQLPDFLYEKWATLFAERLLETVPPAQICDMCAGTEEADATLALVYVMFMESERMEGIVAQDLRAWHEQAYCKFDNIVQ